MSDKKEEIKAKEMTPEETLEAKKKLFTADPDRFVDTDELIIAVKKAKAGLEIFINSAATTGQLFVAQGEMQYNINKTLAAREYLAMKKAQESKKIVTASGLNSNMRAGLKKVFKH